LFYDPALAAGLDLTKEPAEVAPLAHSCTGGLFIDPNCAATLKGLFAAGEVVGGIHGANRIGGSAGTEIFVYGCLAGGSAADYAAQFSEGLDPAWIEADGERERGIFEKWKGQKGDVSSKEMRNKAGQAIHEGIGILRNERGIDGCLHGLEALEGELGRLNVQTTEDLMHCYTLRNTLDVAKIQATASQMRKESRGVFYREDYPATDENWTKNIRVCRGNDGEMSFTVSDPVQ
jgi:succinate dehydrogenase/fumarate reductase flavoprotein subunit